VKLAETEGIFAEPAAAATIAALKKLTSQGRISPDERVVALITGTGLKDIPSASKAVKIPEPIEPTIEAVKNTLHHIQHADS
jgi:threonine synthase